MELTFQQKKTDNLKKKKIKKQTFGDFSANPLLRLHAPNAGGTGSIPRWETKILSATHNADKNNNLKCLKSSN